MPVGFAKTVLTISFLVYRGSSTVTMVTSKGEYSSAAGKDRYVHSAAKVLIYQTGEPLPDNLKKCVVRALEMARRLRNTCT
jgi:hypothetical protein